MKRFLQSSWAVCLFGSLSYLATTAVLLMKLTGPLPTKMEVEARVAPPPDQDPSWRYENLEFNQWLAELKAERETLAAREEQLKDLQKRLDAERQEILSVTQTVARLQADFDKSVVRFTAQEAENLKFQTKVITGMSPEGAAAMLKEMGDEQVVRMLFSLKPAQSGQILDALSKSGAAQAKRAATIAERLRVVLPSAAEKSP